MSTQPRPRIGHIGLNIRDADVMKDFYTQVMGFTVTDHGPHPVNSCPMLFLSTNPEEHHEIVLIGGRRMTLTTALLSNSHSYLRVLMNFVK